MSSWCADEKYHATSVAWYFNIYFVKFFAHRDLPTIAIQGHICALKQASPKSEKEDSSL